MNDTEKALRYFKSRKAMMLADRVQAYEDIAISSLEKQLNNVWIPCKDKLPEKQPQRVLATLKNEMVLEVWYINNAFKFHRELSCGGLKEVDEYNPVIAWQPLPEPYKEGEQNGYKK